MRYNDFPIKETESFSLINRFKQFCCCKAKLKSQDLEVEWEVSPIEEKVLCCSCNTYKKAANVAFLAFALLSTAAGGCGLACLSYRLIEPEEESICKNYTEVGTAIYAGSLFLFGSLFLCTLSINCCLKVCKR